MSSFPEYLKVFLFGIFGGTTILGILKLWVVPSPSEHSVIFVYLLAFSTISFGKYLNYKIRVRQIEFFELMVHTKEEKILPDNSIEKRDFGRIDENSVKMVERFKELVDWTV